MVASSRASFTCVKRLSIAPYTPQTCFKGDIDYAAVSQRRTRRQAGEKPNTFATRRARRGKVKDLQSSHCVLNTYVVHLCPLNPLLMSYPRNGEDAEEMPQVAEGDNLLYPHTAAYYPSGMQPSGGRVIVAMPPPPSPGYSVIMPQTHQAMPPLAPEVGRTLTLTLTLTLNVGRIRTPTPTLTLTLTLTLTRLALGDKWAWSRRTTW